jgi:hypothetical protein
VTPGIFSTARAINSAKVARGAISVLEGQLTTTTTAARAAKIGARIARNEAAVRDANTTILQQVGGTVLGKITKVIESPTPLRIGNDCDCGRK